MFVCSDSDHCQKRLKEAQTLAAKSENSKKSPNQSTAQLSKALDPKPTINTDSNQAKKVKTAP
jgi:hypothetical protein